MNLRVPAPRRRALRSVAQRINPAATAVLLALVTVPGARAQDTAPAAPERALSVIRPGSCSFPDEAVLGTSTSRALLSLQYTVTPEGAFVQAEVTESSGDAAFDARQLEWLKSCTFEPGRLSDSLGNRRGRMVVWPAATPRTTESRSGVDLKPRIDITTPPCELQPGDIPPSLVLRSPSGTYHVRRWVRADGRPAILEWVRATGTPTLDRVAFRVFTRCDLNPGTDAEGRPQAGFLDLGFTVRYE